MSEYQYYEFCRINRPLSSEARQVMQSLSSRAQVTTHGAVYVYNYGDFRGNPKQLLLNYFDVFFYISNFGTVQLMFHYPKGQVDSDHLKKYAIEDSIACEVVKSSVLLTIDLTNEEGFGWTEGEGLLPDLLPLYDEIKKGDDQFLRLVTAIHQEWMGKNQALDARLDGIKLSKAQAAFLGAIGVDEPV